MLVEEREREGGRAGAKRSRVNTEHFKSPKAIIRPWVQEKVFIFLQFVPTPLGSGRVGRSVARETPKEGEGV